MTWPVETRNRVKKRVQAASNTMLNKTSLVELMMIIVTDLKEEMINLWNHYLNMTYMSG